jgi:sulfite reductase alpha subunit-like flavoprotein
MDGIAQSAAPQNASALGSEQLQLVDRALRRIVAERGGLSDGEADAYVSRLAQSGRYQRDVY